MEHKKGKHPLYASLTRYASGTSIFEKAAKEEGIKLPNLTYKKHHQLCTFSPFCT